MDVPEMLMKDFVPLNQHDLTRIPGALTSGLSLPSGTVGPTLLKKHNSSFSFVAPTAITYSKSPGLLAVLHSGPSLPIAQTGIIPAALRDNAHRSKVLSP